MAELVTAQWTAVTRRAELVTAQWTAVFERVEAVTAWLAGRALQTVATGRLGQVRSSAAGRVELVTVWHIFMAAV